MRPSPLPSVCFAIVLPRCRDWFSALSTAFTHPWVLSYQIGFGPPLVRASDGLITAVREAKSALEKLEAYLNHCYLNEMQRRRLAQLHRKLLVRRFGPVEAEAIRRSSRDVLDLSVQLYPPLSAPEAVRDQMRTLGALKGVTPEDPPENRTGRFWLHLSDPANTRLMEVDSVHPLITDADHQAVLALTVPAVGAELFSAWIRDWASPAGWPSVQLEGPVSVARAYRDGVGI